MPSVFTRPSNVPGLGEIVVLTDAHAQSRVELAPARGAIVTSFVVAGRELLYLDPATLADPGKNVRGGIPVLFPSPGKLTGDTFSHANAHGAMKQHGLARALPWTLSTMHADAARITLTLRSSVQTRAQFPWDFAFDLTFSLAGTCLTLGICVRNPGREPLPFALGFHPYFRVDDKRGARIDTRATRAFDNASKREVVFRGFDLEASELDLHLLDHGSTQSALHLADGSCIDVRASSEFTRWVVWTLGDQPYVCLEPWSAPFDALNTGEGLLHVPPGSSHEGFVSLTFRT
jgi:galactose mutarotase-like enzyme